MENNVPCESGQNRGAAAGLEFEYSGTVQRSGISRYASHRSWTTCSGAKRRLDISDRERLVAARRSAILRSVQCDDIEIRTHIPERARQLRNICCPAQSGWNAFHDTSRNAGGSTELFRQNRFARSASDADKVRRSRARSAENQKATRDVQTCRRCGSLV